MSGAGLGAGWPGTTCLSFGMWRGVKPGPGEVRQELCLRFCAQCQYLLEKSPEPTLVGD